MTKPVILITGATSGFGRATAEEFAKNGWKVIATGRRQERLDALQKEFGADIIHTIQMDLTDQTAIADGVANVPKNFKPVKCLFNNGGLALGTKPMPDIKLSDWRTMIETNIMGLLHMTHECLPLLEDAGPGAAIINVGSVAGRFAYPGGNVYGASKAFVDHFSSELRCDLEGKNIRVTSLVPGMAKSEFSAVRTYGDHAFNEKFYQDAKPILPEDIANTVWWLANQPDHININSIEIMPLCQVPAIPKILRDTD